MPYREDIPGYMSTYDLLLIEFLASCVPEQGVVVEVGSYFGRSAWAWAHSIPRFATVYCIDPWPGIKGEHHPDEYLEASFEDFQAYVKDCSNLIPIRGYSPSMPWDKHIRPDLVFVDGCHFSPTVNEDLAFWSAQLQPYGILCGHDFNPGRWPDVCEAVIHQSALLKKPFHIFEESSIWYIEVGREKLNPHSRERLIQRMGLEELSWSPSAMQIELFKKFYPTSIH